MLCASAKPACGKVTMLLGMAKKFPLLPAHPERNCWGCDQYCARDAMACGNGSDRTLHPMELFGDDWWEWMPPPVTPAAPATACVLPPAQESAASPRSR